MSGDHNMNQKPPVKTYCGGKPNYCTFEDDDTQVYRSEMEAAVKAAYKDCAQIAETAEPYQAADLIRARAAMLFDDWDGGFPYRKEER